MIEYYNMNFEHELEFKSNQLKSRCLKNITQNMSNIVNQSTNY